MKKAPTKSRPNPWYELLGVMPEDQLFDVLKISHASGRQRGYAGTLPAHYKVGREKLYDIDEVKAWMRRRRVDRAA